jgi:TM2 domain-containing membrane protein YozV
MKSRTTAAILAFLLGGIGVHKFYLGDTGKGILYLVFCWTCIPAILGLIDFVRFLTMSDEAFSQKYSSQ